MVEKLNLTKHSGSEDAKSMDVSIVPGTARWLGRGGYGTVAENALRVEHNGQERIVHLALKNYRNYGRANEEKEIEHEFAMYKACKDAGMHVLPTYRIDTNRGIIAMTDFSDGGEYVVFSTPENSSSVPNEKELPKLQHIDNFESFIRSFLQDAKKAADNNIQIYRDAFLFRFLKDGRHRGTLEYVLSDFNNVGVFKKERKNNLCESNLSECRLAVTLFLLTFVEKDAQKELVDTIDKIATTI